MSDEMKMTHPYEGNKCHGEINVVLDTTDVGDSPTGRRFDLKVWFGGLDLGGDDEPTVWFTVNDERDRYHRNTDGDCDCMFNVSVARLRRICDMIEASHKVGLDQWKEVEGDANGSR